MDRLEPTQVSSDHVHVEVSTFGCKVNTYDTGLIQQRLSKAGFAVSSKARDSKRHIHVLNSCAVTAEATSQVLRQARKLKRDEPESVVVVTGCSAQVDTERFTNAPSVDLVVANSHKGELPALLKDLLNGKKMDRVHKSNIFKKEDVEAGGGEELGHTRSFLKIQDGCDSFCTFCVIPFARGKSRSIEPAKLAEKINQMHASGVNEAVLTGVHIGDYVSEAGQDLTQLLKYVLVQTRMPRLRLSSLEPIELNPELLSLFADERMCRHFHMSIQSASTTVLAKMKRKYSAEQVSQALDEIEKTVPGAFVGMDVIAGFPEESDQEFLDTLQRLKDSPWTRLHVFPYSARPNTYAARAFVAVESSKIKERAFRLRELSHERHVMHAIAQIGLQKKTLWLKHHDQSVVQGLARDYWSVILNDKDAIERHNNQTSQEDVVRIVGCDREPNRSGIVHLYGTLEK